MPGLQLTHKTVMYLRETKLIWVELGTDTEDFDDNASRVKCEKIDDAINTLQEKDARIASLKRKMF